MPFKYEVDSARRLLLAQPHGVVTLEEISAYFLAAADSPEVPLESIEVVDLNGISEYRFSSEDAQRLPVNYDILKQNKQIEGTIFIAEQGLHYGMARLFQIMNELNRPENRIEVITEKAQLEEAIARIRRSSGNV